MNKVASRLKSVVPANDLKSLNRLSSRGKKRKKGSQIISLLSESEEIWATDGCEVEFQYVHLKAYLKYIFFRRRILTALDNILLTMFFQHPTRFAPTQ